MVYFYYDMVDLSYWYDEYPDATLHSCSYKKVFWKYAANLQENIHAEMWFQ